MTGVTNRATAFLPGIRCIARRMRELQSTVPLVIAVPTDEAASVRESLQAWGVLGGNVSLVRWNRLNYEPPLHGFTRRWKDTRVLSKLNLLGAPYRRVVWLDTDVLLKRNVDHLCRTRPHLAFTAVYNHGHEPRTCWSHDGRGADECSGCRHHGVQRDELSGGYWVRKGLSEQAKGNRSGMPSCRYEFNSGVLLVEPLNQSDFHRRVVAPVSCRQVHSRDGGDQGAFNSLVYGHGLFGERYGPLSFTCVSWNQTGEIASAGVEPEKQRQLESKSRESVSWR